jgi:lysophospholipase L1-like esterase
MTYALRVPSAATTRSRRPRWPLVVLALAVAAVCALAAWRPWAASVPRTPVAAADGLVAAAPAPLELPDDPRILVFGDSWTYGSAASTPTLGYAYLLADRLNADVVVAGVRGSGYLKPGIDGGSFGERIAELDPALDPDLVILQGSINDRRLPAEGYREAVDAAWDALSARYPGASIVVLGPAPQVLPVERPTARIDGDLAALAAQRGWWYVSPITEGWITPANYLDVIDTGEVGRDHPSTDGHAYLADRVAEAVRGMGATGDVTADAPLEPVAGPR